MLETSALLVLVGLISISCQYIAFKLRFPAILPLLVAGILLGPIFGVLNPDALFGDLLFPLVSLSVAIILFEGALTLRFKEVADHGSMVRNLCTIGALTTWFVVTPIAHYALNVSWQIAFLIGAIVTVTGPTVIVPMLRSVRPSSGVANILRWEGIIIDPIGALLAVLVFEFIVSSQHALLHTLQTFGLTLASGGILGCVCGYVLGLILRNNWVPHYLRNTTVLTLMLGAFAASNILAHESGLLTVTVMGIWLANMDDVDVEDILEFKETLSVLLISALFILLAARLELSSLVAVGTGAIAVLAAILFVARPLSVVLSSIGTNLNWREIALLSWIAPRGIVAAAVSALFAIKLEALNYEKAELIVPMVFLVIITTVVLQSLSAGFVASALKLRLPDPHGVLIFGASKFSRMLATELIAHDIPVRIADTNWDAIREARMDNIPVYYGSPISEHAERTLDLSAIGQVLVMSPYRQLNPLISYHFEYMVGKGAVKGLNLSETEARSSHRFSEDYLKKLGLFGEQATYGRIASLVAKGAVIKSTRLSESFSMDDYRNTWGDSVLPLCAIAPNKLAHWFTATSKFEPKADWQIISLINADAVNEKQRQKEQEKIIAADSTAVN